MSLFFFPFPWPPAPSPGLAPTYFCLIFQNSSLSAFCSLAKGSHSGMGAFRAALPVLGREALDGYAQVNILFGHFGTGTAAMGGRGRALDCLLRLLGRGRAQRCSELGDLGTSDAISRDMSSDILDKTNGWRRRRESHST